jgi:excisionase family DNA binding protein
MQRKMDNASGTVKQSAPDEREYISVAEASRVTSLSGWTLRHWAYEGRIASVKIGSRLLLPVKELRRVLAEHTRPAVKPAPSQSAPVSSQCRKDQP